MLGTIDQLLARKRIVLASSSPRRQQLIRCLEINVESCPSNFEENLNPGDYESFSKYIEATAQGKAEEVYNRLKNETFDRDLLVIGADTLVTMGSEIYGKPRDRADAIRMLTNLSGKCNRVYTGVVLKYAYGIRSFTEHADVYFANLTKQQIEDYVDTGEPMDKAGAFGVQGAGATLIRRIDGDFNCVLGLPLHRLCRELVALYTTPHHH